MGACERGGRTVSYDWTNSDAPIEGERISEILFGLQELLPFSPELLITKLVTGPSSSIRSNLASRLGIKQQGIPESFAQG